MEQPAPEHCLASGARRAQFIARLRDALPAEQILSQDDELMPYECDGLTLYKQKPNLVVMPDSIEQIQAVMRLCHAESIPVVARGAGTGLSGGALPHENGVLLSLAKLNQILRIDAEHLRAVVQPGVRNLAISEAASAHNLFYAPDPSSQIACSIGGNVAENSGGVHSLKYGLTVHNILKLKLVSVEGEVFEIGGESFDSPGLDLLALLTGSEGMLAVAVEITVKLLPRPEATEVLLASFDDVEKAGRAVADVIAGGVIPAGLEMMDNPAIRASEDYVGAGYPVDAQALLICELDGARGDVAAQVKHVRQSLEAAGAVDIRLAKDKEEQQKFWLGRKSAFPAVGRLAPDYYCMDGTIPKNRLAEVLTRISALAQQFELGVANVFHAGDGNLHPLILFDSRKENDKEKAEQFGAAILELCLQVGGTITGEHGVGVEKINQMCIQFNSAEIEQMHALKKAFDPAGTLNPGKAVPTLNRCAEFGALHVHNNQLPHPDIPRF